MKTWSFYHQDTGIFANVVVRSTDDRAGDFNTPADHKPIEGQYDPARQRVDVATGTVIYI